jgi:hypothetical protein
MTKHEQFEYICSEMLHLEDLIDQWCYSHGIDEQIASQLKDLAFQPLCRHLDSLSRDFWKGGKSELDI